MATYVGEFDPDSASYFSTDFKLTQDIFEKVTNALVK